MLRYFKRSIYYRPNKASAIPHRFLSYVEFWESFNDFLAWFIEISFDDTPKKSTQNFLQNAILGKTHSSITSTVTQCRLPLLNISHVQHVMHVQSLQLLGAQIHVVLLSCSDEKIVNTFWWFKELKSVPGEMFQLPSYFQTGNPTCPCLLGSNDFLPRLFIYIKCATLHFLHFYFYVISWLFLEPKA